MRDIPVKARKGGEAPAKKSALAAGPFPPGRGKEDQAESEQDIEGDEAAHYQQDVGQADPGDSSRNGRSRTGQKFAYKYQNW